LQNKRKLAKNSVLRIGDATLNSMRLLKKAKKA